ncbi:MAG: Tm-1-like ATP-binding domain-containing protein [Thermoguttaceae bacterium]|nr:Tm-1-like ATP-binding domain-containing protein [Thermoguttaceae bacterium]MDW8079009.1 Tm-1-like ATP-binding domain-containing protein [Thermoguttaceae bacterium]
MSSATATKIVALVGALDTKGAEYAFLRECIRRSGFGTFLIDFGVLGTPAIWPDISRQQVAEAAGADIRVLAAQRDRGSAMAAMARGMEILLPKLYAEGRFHAVMALGGGGGTSVAAAGMRALPYGVPKVIVSTVAGGDVSGYVGVKDIVMIPSIVDIAGLNRFSRRVLAQAAGAICGMLSAELPPGDDKPLIAATMFGNTTPCVEHARRMLEEAGFEVLVFHATGTGGKTMENLIRDGLITAVLDVTTTEWADELVGGVLAAGPHRLEAAAETGIPAVIAPGCLDMVNFWAPETIPPQFRGRRFYQHNPNITLMRTTPEECARLGEIVAEKLNRSKGPVSVLIPLRGWSMIDAPGGPFWWPEADEAFRRSLREHLRPDIPVIELDANINDPVFAEACARQLLHLLAQKTAAKEGTV